jgi:hypothetical protein
MAPSTRPQLHTVDRVQLLKMRRSLMAAAAVALLLVVAAGTTWAATPAPKLGSQLGGTVQLGGTNVRTPVCPAGVKPQNCVFVMTRVTALQTLSNGNAHPAVVKQAGQLVGFVVGLAQLSSNSTTAAGFARTLNAKYGGQPAAQITVLRPQKNNRWTVAAQGPIVQLQRYLGYVVQFPLPTPIQVRPGEAIGLTVPTWAPILSYNLSPKLYSYRQSRASNCKTVGAQQNAQTRIGAAATYACAYPGTRAEYSGIELTSPVAPK